MSVQKIKSDLNNLCNTISKTITECERMKTSVNGLGNVSESDLTHIISSADNCINSITVFDRILTTVHNECSIELDIFFRDFNTKTKMIMTDCKEMIAQLKTLIETCRGCYEFYQISNETEWIIMCGITPDIFNWIEQPLYSFKNQLQMVQMSAYTNNNKLIVKVR